MHKVEKRTQQKKEEETAGQEEDTTDIEVEIVEDEKQEGTFIKEETFEKGEGTLQIEEELNKTV